MKTARTLTLHECLDILRLPRDASLDDLKRAYRRRAFELHPDLNPDQKNAHVQFQQLNEAYVALSAMLKPAAAQAEKARGSAHTEAGSRQKSADPAGAAAAGTGHSAEYSAAGSARASAANAAGSTSEQTGDARAQAGSSAQAEQRTSAGAEQGDARQRQRAHAYERADVLRDLLNDPFARRVFADIYSELNKKGREQTEARQEARKAEEPPRKAPPPPPRQEKTARVRTRSLPFDWAERKLRNAGGLKGAVSGWLRGQIDDAQSMCLPAAMLQAGRRIRLQIRRAFASEASTIEITLPQDFVPGKSVRLRGLGKKIGPWQGDLYLTLESK